MNKIEKTIKNLNSNNMDLFRFFFFLLFHKTPFLNALFYENLSIKLRKATMRGNEWMLFHENKMRYPCVSNILGVKMVVITTKFLVILLK